MSEITFEEALESLERLVRSMEAGKLTLDESLSTFEEGIKLVKLCNEKLDSAEQRVKILLDGGNGEKREEPFTPPAG